MEIRDSSRALLRLGFFERQSKPQTFEGWQAWMAMPRSTANLCKQGLRIPYSSLTPMALFTHMAFSGPAFLMAGRCAGRRLAARKTWGSGGLRSDDILMLIAKRSCGPELNPMHNIIHAAGSIRGVIAAKRQRLIMIVIAWTR
jgi:hypothetical protein